MGASFLTNAIFPLLPGDAFERAAAAPMAAASTATVPTAIAISERVPSTLRRIS
jgi:hypothetical protein